MALEGFPIMFAFNPNKWWAFPSLFFHHQCNGVKFWDRVLKNKIFAFHFRQVGVKERKKREKELGAIFLLLKCL